MIIIKEGKHKELPKSFKTVCGKLTFGCKAELEVFTEDCFKCPFVCGSGHYLSFFCEACGTICTPDYDFVDEYRSGSLDSNPLGLTAKTKDNVPPWSDYNFPTIDEFCKKHDIKWGIR